MQCCEISFQLFFEITLTIIEISSQYVAQKMKFSITDFFRKCDQIRSLLLIWSHLLKKSVMENFIFCAVVCSCAV